MYLRHAKSNVSPFRPCAGSYPPVLAGREQERKVWRGLLSDHRTTGNLVITGLHGLGKTALLQDFAVQAQRSGWLWVQEDFSNDCPVSEEGLGSRIINDTACALAKSANQPKDAYLESLQNDFDSSFGLTSDKISSVFLRLSTSLRRANCRGLILACDEAHLLVDRALPDENLLSLLVEFANGYQRTEKEFPVLLVLSGLPHLLDALDLGQSYAERLFRVMPLYPLTRQEAQKAVEGPISEAVMAHRPLRAIGAAVKYSGGYPCFLQYFGHELFQALQQPMRLRLDDQFPSRDVLNRLDGGLFMDRWARLNRDERGFLQLLADLDKPPLHHYSAEDVALAVDRKAGDNSMLSRATEMFAALREKGLLYPCDPGCFAFAVPFMEKLVANCSKSRPAIELLRWWSRPRWGAR